MKNSGDGSFGRGFHKAAVIQIPLAVDNVNLVRGLVPQDTDAVQRFVLTQTAETFFNMVAVEEFHPLFAYDFDFSAQTYFQNLRGLACGIFGKTPRHHKVNGAAYFLAYILEHFR